MRVAALLLALTVAGCASPTAPPTCLKWQYITVTIDGTVYATTYRCLVPA